MAASDHLHPQLFHGTGGPIHGGVVQASNAYDYGTGHNYAYATSNRKVASRMARHRAQGEGRLFGSVYEVAPLTEGIKAEQYGDSVEYRDPKGYQVLREVESPINPQAL